jgi:phosphate starvation-inducible PhoH-like protein
LALLVGPQDRHLNYIEKRLGISLALRGNCITITGNQPESVYAEKVLSYLYEQLRKGGAVGTSEIDHALQFIIRQTTVSPGHSALSNEDSVQSEVSIVTKRRIVFPRSAHQSDYIRAMQTQELVFGIGPAGTGKTYLAVAQAVSLLLEGKIDRIILSRPAVEAGERLGFLPGDMKEKVDPYLRPLYDALHDMLPPEQVTKCLSNGEIEVAPLAFMRGRTLSQAFIILDEAQNTTAMQMKMLLTRLGPHSQMVINGDLTQIDLPSGVVSGLKNVIQVLKNVSDISFITFNEEDVVRHPLVAKIVRAYESYTPEGTGSHG